MSGLDFIFEEYAVAIWGALGMLLLIGETLGAMTGFFISFALAAFVVASLCWLIGVEFSLLQQCVVFAIMGVLLVPVCRKIFGRFTKSETDINQY